MKRQVKIIMPKLNNCGGDITRQWFVYYSYRDELTGRMARFRIYEGFTKYKTAEKKQAHGQRLINKWRKKLRSGYNPFIDERKVIFSDAITDLKKQLPAPRRVARKTVSYYLAQYLHQKKHSLAKTSLTKYQSQFRIFNQYLQTKNLAEYDITVIDNKVAREFITHLLEKRNLSGKSCNSYIILMTSVWKFISEENTRITNPWTSITKYRETTRPQKPLKKALINIIREDLEKNNPQLWLAAQFQYYCFIRPHELRFLQVKHLDLYECTITVPGDLSKTSKNRTVYIPEEFLRVLMIEYKLNTYPDKMYIFSLKGKPGAKPVSKNYFWFHFDKLRRRLNIPRDYTFYGFKHTGAVAAVKHGANIHTIKEQMGHSSVAITEEYLKDKTGYEDDFFKRKMPAI